MKKVLSLLLTLSMLASLVACGSNAQVTTETKAVETAAETVAETKAEETKAAGGKLIMCTNAEFPPYEYKEGGEFLGIDVECAKKIGEKLGKEVEILDIAFDTLIPTVLSGKADFAMAGMTVTEDRLKNVDFSTTYQNAVQAIIVTKDSAIATADDLKNKLIGVQTGTTGDIYCTGDFGDAALKRYSKITDGVQALKVGQIDAVVIDDQVAKTLVEQDPDSFKILDTPYAKEEYAIAVKKGNTELLNQINAAIEEMKSNGELEAIVSKYIK